MKNFRENLLKYGSYILVFLLPLVYLESMFSPFSSPKTFLFYGWVEILIAFWIYNLVVDNSYRLNKKVLLFFIPLFSYIVWMTLAGVLAVSPALSFWSSLGRGTGLITIYHCLAFALIIASLVKKEGINFVNSLMRWFLNGSFILAISIWFGNEGFNVFDFLKDSAGGGLIGNSSMAAAYLLFALAFGAFLLFSKNISKNKKWWIGIKMVVILFSPLFFNILGLFNGNGFLGSARGATLGIFVIAIFSFFLYLFFSNKRIVKVIGLAGIVLGILLLSIGWMQLINPGTKLHQKFTENASGARFIFWNSARESINEHPWFGYGPENFMIAFQKHFNPQITKTDNQNDVHSDETWTDRAHNIYYDTGVSGGYPAIVLYFVFLLSVLFALFKIEKNKTLNQAQIGILIGLIFGYTFQNFFVFDSLLSLMILFVLVGIIFANTENFTKLKYLPWQVRPLVKNILVSILIFGCVSALVFFTIRPAQKAIAFHDIVNMPIDVRVNYYNDLLKGSSIGDQWDASGIAGVIYKYYASDLVNIKKDKSLAPYVDGDLLALISYLDVLAKEDSRDPRLFFEIASLNTTEITLTEKPYNPVLAGHLFNLLDKAQELSSLNNPEIYWGRAYVYAWAGDIKNVEKSYKDAIAIGPDIPESYNLLLKFSSYVNDKKTFNETIEQAKKNIPNFQFNN